MLDISRPPGIANIRSGQLVGIIRLAGRRYFLWKRHQSISEKTRDFSQISTAEATPQIHRLGYQSFLEVSPSHPPVQYQVSGVLPRALLRINGLKPCRKTRLTTG